MTIKGKTQSCGTYSGLLFGVNVNLNLSNIELEPLSVVNVLFYAEEDFVIVNHLILVANFYNDCCKLNGVKNSNAGLKNKNVSNTQYRRQNSIYVE